VADLYSARNRDFTDLRSRRIPNWLVLPFLVAGLAVSVWQHAGGLGTSLEGLALGAFLYGILCFMAGWGWRRKAVAAIGRGSDRPVVFCADRDRYGGRRDGAFVGGARRFPGELFQGSGI